MSHTVTVPFKVRLYELDSLGHVNNAVYLRYCEQAAMEASESVGYTLEKYREKGWIWVIKHTILEHVAPAFYGDIIEVTTWISQITPASTFREYLLTRQGDGALIARARSRWVLLDAESGRPLRMPAEMRELFRPNGKIAVRDLKPMRGEKPIERAKVFSHQRKVQRYELDSAGHVNNAVYLNWLEQAKFDAMASVGYTTAWLKEVGITIVQVRAEIEYMKPAVEGDELEIISRLAAMARTHGTWEHLIYKKPTGELIARAWSTGAFLNPSGNPTRAPEELINALTE
jgi:acyl-CoA thioester hydrolase